MKRCYYEILEVDKKATTSQVKTAYRKMALKYYPDKNPSQQGKKIFMEVQQAYDVLSDANQRTFYDNNREKILFNKDDMSKEDLEQYSFGFNIWEYFTVKCFKGFTDEPGSFFSVYRDVFQKIKAEQLKAYKSRDDLQQQMRKYEGFGTSTTSIEKTLVFYENWQNFTTYKTFAWSQEYDTRDAQNRWVKRRMQQQNKKQRQKQKKTYIKTIKDLVSFVKKRDVRFQQHLIHLRQQQQKKQKEKLKKQEEKKKQKEDMKKIKQKLEQQRFRQIEQYYKQNNAPQQKTQFMYQDEQDIPEFFCTICDKTFKSQNQLMNHQKSKIHKQNVKLLQKQVMLPGQKVQQALKQDEQGTQNVTNQPAAKKKRNRKKKNKNNNQANNQDEDDQPDQQAQSPQKKQAPKKVQNKTKNQQKKQISLSQQQNSKPQTKANQNKKNESQKNVKKEEVKVEAKKESSESSESSDQDDILMSLAQNRNKKKTHDHSDQQDNKKNKKGGKQKSKGPQTKPAQKKNTKVLQQESDDQDEQQQKKLGKAKLKKMKKAQQQKDNGLKCKSCNTIFPSKTKLFDHLKQTGHATYKP